MSAIAMHHGRIAVFCIGIYKGEDYFHVIR